MRITNRRDLQEKMDMPNPSFPVKLHRLQYHGIDTVMFHHHWHQHIEFLYFVEGTARIECNTHVLHVSPGDLIVVNSNDLHYGVCTAEDLFYYVIIFDTSLLYSQMTDEVANKYITPISQNHILFEHQINGDDQINESLNDLINELSNQTFGYELAIKSHLFRLLTILMRRYVTRTMTLSEYNNRMKNRERFNPIFKYIEEHYDQKITVESLANMLLMSRYHFSRIFKQLTNKTVTEYVNSVRIDKAEALVRTTNMTISEVALTTGFQDIFYFSKVFKKYMNVSPAAYRQQHVGK